MKKYLILLLCAGVSLTSCNSLLDVEPEGRDARFSNEQLKELAKTKPDAVIGGMASALQTVLNNHGTSAVDVRNWRVLMFNLDLKGNDIAHTGTSLGTWGWSEYTALNFNAQNTAAASNQWSFAYKYVYMSNQILDMIDEKLDETSTVEADVKLQNYKGLALTMRAWAYFQLIQLYQLDYLHTGKDKAGIPIYRTTSDPVNGRGQAADVWALINSDLETAVRLLEKNSVSTTDNATDIDANVANGIRAKVALTQGNYSLAVSAANKVLANFPTLMNETQYVTKKNILCVTPAENPEAIWGYKWSITSGRGNSSWAAWMNVMGEGGYGGEQGNVWAGIDQRLYDRIPATDYRKKNFLASELPYTFPSGTARTFKQYTNMKFARMEIYPGRKNIDQDEVYMRASEILLIKAEAQANDPSLGDAAQTLYELVSKRDPSYVKSSATGAALLSEIQLQTRIEMWGEGVEFFNNRRWNLPVNRDGSANHLSGVGVGDLVPVGYNFVFQIPLGNELNYNNFITASDQNPTTGW